MVKWKAIMNKLISVIMPVYNVESYLAEAIESVLAQRYADFELIIVNDGSTDSSLDICQKFAIMDSRVTLYSKKNGGLSSARNYGIARAKGEYLFFIDSDDMLTPDCLEHLYGALMKSGADVAVANHQKFFDKIEKRAGDGAIRFLSGKKYVRDIFGPRCIGAYAWGKLFPCYLFKERLFPEGRLYEDMFTIPYLLYDLKKVVYLKDSLYLYRQRQGSILKTFSAGRVDELYAIHDIVSFASKKRDYLLLWFARINEVRSWCELKSRYRKNGMDFSPVQDGMKKIVLKDLIGIFLPFYRS